MAKVTDPKATLPDAPRASHVNRDKTINASRDERIERMGVSAKLFGHGKDGQPMLLRLLGHNVLRVLRDRIDV